MSSIEGPLHRLIAEPADPVRYSLAVGGPAPQQLALNPLLGTSLEIRYLQQISCRYCAASTAKSYGGGYCYACFKRLARCDLCVVSPDRCHFHQGTCREPEWGEAFCMQPHIVYLANSSGPKVGITRQGHQTGRWLDQGACQALPILSASTRQVAGIAEVNLAGYLPDRTDWRRLVSGDAAPIDLRQLRDELREQVEMLPEGAAWLDAEPVSFSYPISRYGHRPRRLRIGEQALIGGNLLGIKGQFLLFEHGVFNIQQHTSYHVRVTASGESAISNVGGSDQMELF